MTTVATTQRNFNRMARRGRMSKEAAETMRAIGFFFLILASLAMAYDVSGLMAGRGAIGFSGIADIWAYLDRTSYEVIQQVVMLNLGAGTWQFFMLPVMSLPAAMLFGVPGLLLLRRYAPEIKVRAPTALEMEMMRMGINPRTRNRRKY
jgi:hypothetical protein